MCRLDLSSAQEGLRLPVPLARQNRGPLEARTQRGLAFQEAESRHLLPFSVEKLHAIELARSIQQRHQGHTMQHVLEEERIAFVGHGAR